MQENLEKFIYLIFFHFPCVFSNSYASLQILTIFDTCVVSKYNEVNCVKSPTVQRNYSYYVAELVFCIVVYNFFDKKPKWKEGVDLCMDFFICGWNCYIWPAHMRRPF